MDFDPKFIYARIIRERKKDIEQILLEIPNETDNNKKGELLEILSKLVVESPFLKFYEIDKRTSTSEIDIVFIVNKIPGTLFQNFSNTLPVECKNWAKKIGSHELNAFAQKMNKPKAKVGLFFSKEGITGKNFFKDGKGVLKEIWDRDEKVIISISLKEIHNCVEEKSNFYSLLEQKFTDMHYV